MSKLIIFVFLTSVFPHILHGITTIHHDKPEESKISEMATQMVQRPNFGSERQKRLLPYINYYSSNNQRKIVREKFTPFLDSNALPGPFTPIRINPKPDYEPLPEKSPNYAEIFDTLTQLKQAQQAMRQNFITIYRKPVNYVPIQYYDEPYRNIPPTKTTIETYTPTNIDIEFDNTKQKYGETYASEKPRIVDTYIIAKPLYKEQHREIYEKLSQKPIVVYEEKQSEYTENKEPLVHATPKPEVNTIVEERYVAQKLTPINTIERPQYQNQYAPVQVLTEKPVYKVQEHYSSPVPNVPTENTNILAKILKQLQNSNTLPQTFTADNIDNSIRTLVKILNNLRKQERIKTKPVVVIEEDTRGNLYEPEVEEPHTEKPFIGKPEYPPGTFTQIFPANTVDGGTPGRPGIDYPALSSIPQTDFNCKKQRYKGFFGDPHTNCQVWHYCDLNGGQASFLCPNGTIFSQVALTCDWWYNVKCSNTAQQYVLNERLYKYIIPLTPKFPEDYSGPLVDKYLAIKFQEMEEKMKSEKKNGDESEEEKDDSDQLQDIKNERIKSSEET